MKEIVIRNEQETRAFALALAKDLKPGAVLGLTGNLGTGKTTLTRYLAEGLGIDEPVQSPTFTIVREHLSGRLPLYHFDVYRIDDPEDLFETGYEDYFYGDGVAVVEWADKIRDLMPEDTRWIHLEYGDTEEGRRYLCSF